ncbi:hypothetical protein BZL39_L02220 [Zygosaccharomyces parabailii]|nr:hypothetical protein BZL39_L02220 [Zygosaccharomyces parabailii]CDH15458.1 uncharacterized protein ZBAI_07245 [Zygosaccharomyces bailii ISA1307]
MFEKLLGGVLLQECAGGSAIFFIHHILFFDFVGICGLDIAIVWLMKSWGYRAPFGCDLSALVQVYAVLLSACFYVAVHTCVCTQMNDTVLPEYLKMVADGADWREIAMRTNELARQQGCIFHQIFYGSEQCRRYFIRSIVRNVEKGKYKITVGDGEHVTMDPELALDAVSAYNNKQELMKC